MESENRNGKWNRKMESVNGIEKQNLKKNEIRKWNLNKSACALT